jgi:hypothetical protein
LSLVSKAFVEFAKEIEPQMRERIENMWPELRRYLGKDEPPGKKKSSSRKKKSA